MVRLKSVIFESCEKYIEELETISYSATILSLRQDRFRRYRRRNQADKGYLLWLSEILAKLSDSGEIRTTYTFWSVRESGRFLSLALPGCQR